MTEDERRVLRARFSYACGYCGVTESQTGAPLTVDHFQPSSCGGADDQSNWVYSCFACNTFKGAFWVASVDEFLLHPLRDNLLFHVREEEDGRLTALSTRGRLHIERLHLNRPELVMNRLERRLQHERDQRIRQLVDELQQMNEELSELKARLDR